MPADIRRETRDWSPSRKLSQLRHFRLTDLAEHGMELPILLARGRHTSLSSLGIYTRPTFDAVAAVTTAVDSDRRH